jgi:hypothetical protein
MANGDDSIADDSKRPNGLERAAAILAELAEAFGSAVVALVEEQRIEVAERTTAVAAALRCAARSLDERDSPSLADRANRAADRVDDVARFVRERDWRDIAAEFAAFARRRPGLFGLAALSLGFLAGRLLLVPEDRGGPGDRAATAEGGGEAADRVDRDR